VRGSNSSDFLVDGQVATWLEALLQITHRISAHDDAGVVDGEVVNWKNVDMKLR